MQLDVPHSIYGKCDFFITESMYIWLMNNGLSAKFQGTDTWGSGFDQHGKSTTTACYKVEGIDETDATAFGIMFPGCDITIFK